jgi:hypothetical protein
MTKILSEIKYRVSLRVLDASMPLARVGMKFAIETYAERARRNAR